MIEKSEFNKILNKLESREFSLTEIEIDFEYYYNNLYTILNSLFEGYFIDVRYEQDSSSFLKAEVKNTSQSLYSVVISGEELISEGSIQAFSILISYYGNLALLQNIELKDDEIGFQLQYNQDFSLWEESTIDTLQAELLNLNLRLVDLTWLSDTDSHGINLKTRLFGTT